MYMPLFLSLSLSFSFSLSFSLVTQIVKFHFQTLAFSSCVNRKVEGPGTLAPPTAPTDELDLLGSPVMMSPVTDSTGSPNPFTPQYDPFADVWDKDDDPHFC